MFLTTPIWCSF